MSSSQSLPRVLKPVGKLPARPSDTLKTNFKNLSPRNSGKQSTAHEVDRIFFESLYAMSDMISSWDTELPSCDARSHGVPDLNGQSDTALPELVKHLSSKLVQIDGYFASLRSLLDERLSTTIHSQSLSGAAAESGLRTRILIEELRRSVDSGRCRNCSRRAGLRDRGPTRASTPFSDDTSQKTTSSMPEIEKVYRRLAGDVGNLFGRMSELTEYYDDDKLEREHMSDQGNPMLLSDDEFESNHRRDYEEAERQYLNGLQEARTAYDHCMVEGLVVPYMAKNGELGLPRLRDDHDGSEQDDASDTLTQAAGEEDPDSPTRSESEPPIEAVRSLVHDWIRATESGHANTALRVDQSRS
nr:hypothetical protein B0A51_03187 [Rachicladosporium sp. CCFEE 5018]